MKKYIVIGGSNGIGASISELLINQGHLVDIFDISEPIIESNNIVYHYLDLSKDDFIYNDSYDDYSGLIITAGIGRVNEFSSFSIPEIKKTLDVNLYSIIKIIKLFYHRLLSCESFDLMVFGSISGDISSPLFSLYSATKAGLNRFCESLNIELEKKGSANRITCIKPISFSGSSFNGGPTRMNELYALANECLSAMISKKSEYYPNPEVTNSVLNRYKDDPHGFGLESYEYKVNNNRLSNRQMIKVGYLSGTFDLFHIGHLNLLKRAKEYCDYLVVGVHKDGSHKKKDIFIPLEERMEILRHIKEVDDVIVSMPEDSDVHDIVKYDYLFVGSDYKGSDRFNRYEKILGEKGVKIIYFPYTKGTSSTELREALSSKK